MPDPLPVKGYTSQSDDKVALVNLNKQYEEMVLRQIDGHRGNDEIDQRMVSIAFTKIQEAFMWLNRSVFQPERLEGPLTEVAQIAKEALEDAE